MNRVGEYSGAIRLVVFDVDGVLTDGSLLLSGEGEVLKKFNVRDGLAVALLRAHNVRTGVLSGKASGPLDFRMKELAIDIVKTGRLDKKDAFKAIALEAGLGHDAIAFVGDDVVDLPLAGLAGYFYAPSDAHPLVLHRADYVLEARGGQGAAREAAEHILTSGGLSLEQAYEPLLERWGSYNATQ